MQTSPDFDRRFVRTFRLMTALSFLTLWHSLSFAQTVSASSHTAKATANVAAAFQPLVVADELFGLTDGLVRELRNGGYVLYLRHGVVLPDRKSVV